MAIDRTTLQEVATDLGAIRRFRDLNAECAQAGGHCGDAIRFLDPQFRRALDRGRTIGAGRRGEKHREFVDHVGDVLERHFDAM